MAQVLLFESPGVAQSFADHLRQMGVSTGIGSRRADWGVLKGAKFPPIIGTAPKTMGERKTSTMRKAQQQKRRRYHDRALLVSEQKAESESEKT